MAKPLETRLAVRGDVNGRRGANDTESRFPKAVSQRGDMGSASIVFAKPFTLTRLLNFETRIFVGKQRSIHSWLCLT